MVVGVLVIGASAERPGHVMPELMIAVERHRPHMQRRMAPTGNMAAVVAFHDGEDIDQRQSSKTPCSTEL